MSMQHSNFLLLPFQQRCGRGAGAWAVPQPGPGLATVLLASPQSCPFPRQHGLLAGKGVSSAEQSQPGLLLPPLNLWLPALAGDGCLAWVGLVEGRSGLTLHLPYEHVHALEADASF